MKRDLVYRLYRSLEKISQWEEGKLLRAKFSYAIAKNKKILEPELKKMLEKAPKPIHDYEIERHKILFEHATRDSAGEIVWEIENAKAHYTEEAKVEVTSKLKALEDSNRELLDEYNKQVEIYKAYIDEDVDINLYKISINDLPDFPHQDYIDIFEEAGLILP